VSAVPADGATRGRHTPAWIRRWPLYPSLLFLAVVFIYPTLVLLSLSVFKGEALSLHQYERLWTSPVYRQVLANTLQIAGWTTFLAVVAGYPVAYLLATVRGNTRNALIIWVLMPFWTSFLVRTFAWIVLLGRNGAVNDLLGGLGILDEGEAVSLIYNFTGVMIGMVHALMPLCVLTMLSVMENIDRNLTAAAGTLGARGGQAFWRVYFPLSLPGVAAGALLVFITSLGFFITPALLGGRKETMIGQVIITQIQEILNWGFAGAISVLLLVTVLFIFFFYDQLLGISTIAGESTAGKQRRSPISRLGGVLGRLFVAGMGNLCELAGAAWDRLLPRPPDQPAKRTSRGVLWLTALLVIGFLAVPAFFVIPVSFTEEAFLGWPPQGFSLQWYERVSASPFWFDAAGRSFFVAICAAGLAMILGVPAAFVLMRERLFGRTAILALLISPIILPNIIIAVGLFYFYAKIGLIGTSLGLILGHTVLTIPYVVVTVMALLKNYDRRLDQAAWTLGASKVRTLWHVTMPLMRSGLIAAFMFAFIISFDELTVALFVTGGDFLTLPRKMWDDAILQVSPSLAAVATMLLAFMSVVILASELLRRRANR